MASATESRVAQSKLKPLLLVSHLPDSWISMGQASHFAYLSGGLENQNLSQQDLEAYQGAVQYLDWAYRLHQRCHDRPTVRKHILAFPGKLSKAFVLLEIYDPRALINTAHFFTLFKFVDEIWYLQGVSRREVL